MADGLRSLRSLVEERAASHGIALRTLWGWALEAIVAGSLIPVLPTGITLDTPSNQGGRPLSLRTVVNTASRSIARYIPENANWANTLMFDPEAFERWLIRDGSHRVRSPNQGSSSQRRRPVTEGVENILSTLFPTGAVPDQTAVPNKMLYKLVHDQIRAYNQQSEFKVQTNPSNETILRAAGRRERRKPSPARPRK